MVADPDDVVFLPHVGEEPWCWGPPPRAIEPATRRRLLLSQPFLLVATLWFGVASLVGIPMALIPDPVGDREFPGGVRTATGLVVGSRSMSDDHRSFQRVAYTFRPDGDAERRGRSFSTTSFADDAAVTVEYAAGDPRINRIQGTHTGAIDLGHSLFVLMFPALAVVMALGALIHRRSLIRLLERGEPAVATIAEFRLASNDEYAARFHPFEEYQRYPLPPVTAPVALGGCLLTGLGVGLMIAAVTACGLLLRRGLQGGEAFRIGTLEIDPRGSATAIIVLGGAAVGLCIALIVLGGRWLVRPIEETPRTLYVHHLQCRFTYTTADGRPFRSEMLALFRTDGRVPATQPALYDPRRPRRAVLVRGLGLPLTCPPGGRWQLDDARDPVGRLALLALGWVGAPLLGLLIANLFR